MKSFRAAIATRRILASAAGRRTVVDFQGQDVGPGDVEIVRGRDIRIGRSERIPVEAIGRVRAIFDRAAAEQHRQQVEEAAERGSNAAIEFVSDPGTDMSSVKDFLDGGEL
jgi:hypothetical protein